MKEFCQASFDNRPERIVGDPTQHITLGRDHGLSLLARITAEGYVSPSPYLNMFFGDLSEQSLPEIWERMKKAWHHPDVVKFLDKYVTCKDGEITIETDDYTYV